MTASRVVVVGADTHLDTIHPELERGLQRNDTLATNYRQWLNAA